MAVLTSLILRGFAGNVQYFVEYCIFYFYFWFSFAIYNCHLVSVAGSQLGDNAPVASALTLVSIPQDNNYVTLEVFGEIPSG